MQRNAEFLEFTPSQQASAALILSLNLCYSQVSESIGLERLGEKFTSPYGEEFPVVADNDIDELNSIFNLKSDETEDPLTVWSNRMCELTKLSAQDDVAPAYSQLIAHIDSNHFKGKLACDSKLWLKEPISVRGGETKILQVTKELVN